VARSEISIHDATGRSWIDADTTEANGLHGLRSKFSSEPDPLEVLVRAEQRCEIRAAMARLSDRQRQAINILYDLDGRGRRTLIEVGKEMGDITPQRVAQLRNDALQRLRYNSKLEDLL
jgi:DNA-directed RNA polymerase sigma subunit (sigma70/sigma32)